MKYNKVEHAKELMNKEKESTFRIIWADSNLHSFKGSKEEILNILNSETIETLISIETSSPMVTCGFKRNII